MKTGTIYILRNKVNGKCYVGQTTKTVAERIQNHKHTKMVIGRAIRKYGLRSFDVLIFKEIPFSMLDRMEQQLIAECKTMNPYGYNISLGGQANRIVSEETARKIGVGNMGKRAWNKGIPMTEERKKVFCRKGKIPWNKGKTMADDSRIRNHLEGYECSEETRERARLSHLGYQMPEEQKRKISAANRGRKKTTEQIKNASLGHMGQKVSEETRKKISDTLKGNIPWNKGLCVWSEEQKKEMSANKMGRKHTADTKRKMSLSHRAKQHPNSRAVICVETRQIFNTITAAANEFKLLRTSITSCCTGRRKTCGNYHWVYYNKESA